MRYKRLLPSKKKIILFILGPLFLIGLAAIPFGYNQSALNVEQKQQAEEQKIPPPITAPIPITIIETPKEQTTIINHSNTNLRIETKHDIIKPNGTLFLISTGFPQSSHVDILFNGMQDESKWADSEGKVSYKRLMPSESGNYTITMRDHDNNEVSKIVQVKQQMKKPSETINKPKPPDQSTKSTFTEDFFPPITTPIINGTYNNNTHWYYGHAPIVMFNATDELSGVRGIYVNYKSCGYPTYQCILKNGDTLKLNQQTEVNKGHIVVPYYAVDNANHTEHEKRINIWYDGVAPDAYIMKIYTESENSIPIGSLCRVEDTTRNCVLINVKRYELLTFQVLGSDKISGIDSIMYKSSIPLSQNETWTVANTPTTGYAEIRLTFKQLGLQEVQIKCNDIAGNQSEIKRFMVKVSET